MKYAVIIEKGNNSYGAYVPDLFGCTAVEETATEVKFSHSARLRPIAYII